MKTLVINGHNDLSTSRINKAWLAELAAHHPEITVHNLCEANTHCNFDVAKEQKLLLEHDRVVFMFPVHWYGPTSLLHRWIEQVLAYGFAYGEGGDKVAGKELMLVMSLGGPQEAYTTTGSNGYSVEEFLAPMIATAKFVRMTMLPMYKLFNIFMLDEVAVAESAKAVAKHIKS